MFDEVLQIFIAQKNEVSFLNLRFAVNTKPNEPYHAAFDSQE